MKHNKFWSDLLTAIKGTDIEVYPCDKGYVIYSDIIRYADSPRECLAIVASQKEKE